jgi:hypothetical protein
MRKGDPAAAKAPSLLLGYCILQCATQAGDVLPYQTGQCEVGLRGGGRGSPRGLTDYAGEIHGKPDLEADPLACHVFASKCTESQAQTLTDQILPTEQCLELPLAQISVLCVRAIDLSSERQRSALAAGTAGRTPFWSR